MEEMKDMRLVDFIDITASKNAVPGGGSVAALCGALSAALAEMVSNLTIGRKKYADAAEEMNFIKKKASHLRKSLIDDIQRDSDVFTLVMNAYRMPKEIETEKTQRSAAIEANLKKAVVVPMEVAEKAYSIMELSETAVRLGNNNAVTDALVSVMMGRTAVLSALLNVKINLSSIKDNEFNEKMYDKVKKLEKMCIEKEETILKSVSL